MSRKRKSAQNDDFVRWDDSDIDLEDILGTEFTDWELEIEEGEWQDEIEEMVANEPDQVDENSKKKKKSPKPKDSLYQCTVCKKKLKTIAGIRGHMSSQHGVKTVKAADYRIQSGPPVTAPVRKRPLSDPEEFQLVFPEVVTSALKHIMEESIYAKSKSANAQVYVQMASTISTVDVTSVMWEDFFHLLKMLDDPVTQAAGREALFTAFHSKRTNRDVTQRYVDSCNLKHGFAPLFIQLLLETILSKLLNKINCLSEKVLLLSTELDAVDQEVLYYIAGYMLRKIKTVKTSGLETFLSEAQVTTSTESTFKDLYSGWTSDISRGGLISVSDNMFLFMRSMESVLVKMVDVQHLNKNSVLSIILKEHIMEDFLVKHYWDKLTSKVSGSSACVMLEYAVSLYQKVRGHAVAKFARRKLMKKNGTKKQKALRKGLKDNSNNPGKK